MRRVGFVLALLLMVGCTTQSGQPAKGTNPEVQTLAAKYISRERAVEIALTGTANAQLGDAKFIEAYHFETPLEPARDVPVWVIELVSKGDLRPQSRSLIDAVSGKVLMVSNPPSGQ